MDATQAPARPAALRRRNTSMALAMLFGALSLGFAFDFDGHVKILWRDAPLVALAFTFCSIAFALRWWRTPRP